MKAFLPFLTVTAFAGLMTVPTNLGAGVMLMMTAGFGAIILQDYSCRRRLTLRLRPALAARATIHVLARPAAVEPNRLAA
jgi:hypothetical protein